MKTDNRKNFEKLVSSEKSGWLEKAQWREDNESWLEKSELIAIRILDTLRSKKISQKELAQTMGVSAQYVNKIVKGGENLSLETISKLENALDIRLIEVCGFQSSMNYQTPEIVQGEMFDSNPIFQELSLKSSQFCNGSYMIEEVA